jgi:peroxiredoxin
MRFPFMICLVLCSAAAGSASANTPAGPQAKPAPRVVAEPDAWLGVGFDGNASSYVRLNEVIRDTPADIAGLVVGDVIVGINDQRIRNGDHLQELIRAHRVGERVKVSVRRGNSSLEVSTELTGKLDPSELIRRRLVDEEAPLFNLSSLHGNDPGDLNQLRGKVVILEFWATSCSECAKTLEPLANFEAESIGDVAVVLITPESQGAIRDHMKDFSLPFTILQDVNSRVKRLYHGELAGPTVVLIGRDGIVRHADTGPDLNIHDLVLQAKRAVREQSAI